MVARGTGSRSKRGGGYQETDIHVHACDDQLIFRSSPPGERRGGGWADGKRRMRREGGAEFSLCDATRCSFFWGALVMYPRGSRLDRLPTFQSSPVLMMMMALGERQQPGGRGGAKEGRIVIVIGAGGGTRGRGTNVLLACQLACPSRYS